MIMQQTFEEFVISWQELEQRPENSQVKGICACGKRIKHKKLTNDELLEMYEILNNDVRRI